MEKIDQPNEASFNEIKSTAGLLAIDFWSNLPQSIKQAMNRAKGELDKGEGISHFQVLAEIKSRFLKS